MLALGFRDKPTTCQAVDLMKLQNKELQNDFFKQLDSIRHIQYPNNDQETEIMVDFTPAMLKQFLKDIDTATLSKTGRFEKEYYFNIAPKGYSDPKVCKDKISVEFDFATCTYRMVIWNSFLVEPNWCTEHQVVYGFTIKNNKIIDLERNEAG